MRLSALTPDTISRLEFLFPPEDRKDAETILIEKCGNNLPFLGEATPQELERFRYAALKISNGNITRLKDAVTLANQDWRDLLVAAHFANDTESHKYWIPRKRNRKFQQGGPGYPPQGVGSPDP